jgi:preprotein translocase subunit SecA
MLKLINRLIGDPNERKVRKMFPLVDQINDLEREIERLSDDELRAKTAQFKQELANRRTSDNPKEDRRFEEEVLELILPEAFAVVREAGKRALGMRHFDVQLIGGMVLHKGGISEMRTGEGKTLVATLPAYLNALTGKGVHVVTVNDYLAKRDAEWMGQLYTFLGLSVGTVLSEQRGFNSFWEKKQAYASDITYGTNNEFGFDYLRDNMAGSRAQLVQRPFSFAIVDEVDSILIDEARTPLIISGRLEQSAETYQTMARLAPTLQPETDYTVDEKARNVILTEEGIDRAQELLGIEDLFDPRTNLAHHLLSALKAKELFKRDIDYVVKDGEVVIVDEFTGRLMDGRRWSDGLHQAVEAKEGVHIQDETQTLASITFQNLFRLYPKLSGMTGTAMTEEAEFGKIYNLEVTTIPTNRLDVRKDQSDVIYKSEKIKFFKVIEDIVESHEQGRPVLVGTTSIEKSEALSHLLTYAETLNGHLHEKCGRMLEGLEKRSDVDAELKAALKDPENRTYDQFKALAEKNESLGQDIIDFLMGIASTARAVQAIRRGVPHNVLNAKFHEQEAKIVAQAGRYGAVTIATNMAGRGTDILLGGNADFLAREHYAAMGIDWHEVPREEYQATLAEMKQVTEAEKQQVIERGGLYIIGTERHESRRIDNQLRGRAGRQGDPGTSRFYLSLEDSFLRIFQSKMIASLMDLLDVDETLPISAPLVTRAIEGAQRKVEAYHFDIRKNILQYDDVLTEQRQLIYGQRRRVLENDRLRDSMQHMIEQEMERLVGAHLTAEGGPEDWDEETVHDMLAQLHMTVPQLSGITAESIKGKGYNDLIALFQKEAREAYLSLEAELTRVAAELKEQHGIELAGFDVEEVEMVQNDKRLSDVEKQEHLHPLRRIERDILLSVIDAKWVDYLHNLDSLREGIGLRAYGQKDPLIEYKREAYEMFQSLTYDIQRETVGLLFRSRIEIQIQQPMEMEQFLADFDETVETPLTDAMADGAEFLHPAAPMPPVEGEPWPTMAMADSGSHDEESPARHHDT